MQEQEKPILDAAEVIRAMSSPRYGTGPVCARCFGFKDADGRPFCEKCAVTVATGMEANSRADELRKAVETSAEFPWINDPDTGLMRLLSSDEICERCEKRRSAPVDMGKSK